ARRADLAAIIRLLADDELGARREKVADPVRPSYLRAFDALTAQKGNGLIVGEEDGEIVACLQLLIVPGLSRQGTTRAFIEGVRVAQTLRGKGVGEALVRHAIDKA